MASKKNISKSKKAAAKKPAGKATGGKVVKKAAPKKAAKKAPAKKTVAKKSSAAKAPAKKIVAPKKSAKKAVKVVKKSAVKPVKKTAVKKTVAAPKKAVAKKVTKAPAPKVNKVEPKKVTKVVKAAPVTSKASSKPVVKEQQVARPAVHIPVVPSVKIESKPMIEKKAETEVKKVVTTQRYNDADLAEFKVLVVNKLEEARRELINLQAQIINANENGTDDTGASFKMLEDGSETLAKEEAANLAARQKKFIEQLEAALIRIENKTYGICRVTGQLIPKERLRAVPHTTQSMEAKLKQYRD
jgi:RNA polymerase-binding transcription factor DksA